MRSLLTHVTLLMCSHFPYDIARVLLTSPNQTALICTALSTSEHGVTDLSTLPNLDVSSKPIWSEPIIPIGRCCARGCPFNP